MMNQRKIYIHIGPAKTGTKTIQRGLKINEQRLRRRNYLCPQSGRKFNKYASQFQLGYELKHFNHLEDFHALRAIVEEIQREGQPKHTILSDEFLRKLDPDKIREIRKAFQDFEVFIVMYLRRQDKILQSHWIQEINNIFYLPPGNIHTYIGMDASRYSDTFVNYTKLIQNWGAVFGRDHLRMNVLEREQVRGNLFQDFLMLCDVKNPDRTRVPPDEHESRGVKKLEVMV